MSDPASSPRNGESGERRGCPAATSWSNGYGEGLSRWQVRCECGFLVTGLSTAEAAEDTYRWHKGRTSTLGGA